MAQRGASGRADKRICGICGKDMHFKGLASHERACRRRTEVERDATRLAETTRAQARRGTSPYRFMGPFNTILNIVIASSPSPTCPCNRQHPFPPRCSTSSWQEFRFL